MIVGVAAGDVVGLANGVAVGLADGVAVGGVVIGQPANIIITNDRTINPRNFVFIHILL
jgi:hypothetical protein